MTLIKFYLTLDCLFHILIGLILNIRTYSSLSNGPAIKVCRGPVFMLFVKILKQGKHVERKYQFWFCTDRTRFTPL